MKARAAVLLLCAVSPALRAEEPDWFDSFRGRAFLQSDASFVAREKSAPPDAAPLPGADAGRRTVRCNLSRLVEETDPDLLNAVVEYGLMKQGLGEAYGPEELLVLSLLAVEKRPPHPSPPIRKRNPLSEDAPEAAELKAAALAALGEEVVLPGKAADLSRAPVDGLVLPGRAVP